MSKPLDLSTHIQTGEELKRIRDTLTEVGARLSSKPWRQAIRAIDAVDALRSLLDSQAIHDLAEDEWHPCIYYPASCTNEPPTFDQVCAERDALEIKSAILEASLAVLKSEHLKLLAIGTRMAADLSLKERL